MEANRQSLVSRASCVALMLSCLVPMVEYFGGLEPTRKSFGQLFVKSMNGEHPPYLMAAWLLPPVLGLLRLSGIAWGANVFFAAASVFVGIAEFFLAVVGPGHPTLAHLQVHFGLEGIVPASHFGLHSTIVAGLSAVWMFDELWAMRTFKAFDAKD